MEKLHNINPHCIQDIMSHYNVIDDILESDVDENITLDFIFDTFQNVILDCESVTNSNTNKYLLNFYKRYKKVYDAIFDYRMKYNDFNILKNIGQGAFGQVQLVRQRQTGDLFALKILNKSQVVNCEGTIFWQEEREIMIKIDSRWIVKLHYAFQDSRYLYMVMDYLPGGNLVNWMSKLEVLSEKDVCFYGAEIVLAINGLHRYGFVHRDIKPDNLLFDAHGHIKLVDFGSCVKMDPVTKFVNCNRAIGTPDYISPEVLLSQSDNSKYGQEVDWWALGVMMYEIFYGEPPFYSDNLINTYGKIMTHEQSLSFPPDEDVSEIAVDFMKNLICDRSIRLGQTSDAGDIKSHSFFRSSNHKWNWDNIQNFTPPFVPKLENDLDTSYFDFDEDDIDKNFSSQDNKELIKPTSFIGENLQFSGFTYSKEVNVSSQYKKPPMIENNSKSPVIFEEKLREVSKENQENKDMVDKLLIEKKDLEIQLIAINNNFKKEEHFSKKLQNDYSDLKTTHSSCQQKFQKLEDVNQNLSSDILKLQVSFEKEKERLLNDIEKLDGHLKRSNVKLIEVQTEYHQNKLRSAKLEKELAKLQEAYDLLETDIALSPKQDGVASLTSKDLSNSDLTVQGQFNQYRNDFETKLKELQKNILENKSLSKDIEHLQTEKQELKQSISELESKIEKEVQTNQKLENELKEKEKEMGKLKNEIKKLHASLDDAVRKEVTATQKMSKMLKNKSIEKQKFDEELEEQRNKFNKIITTKTNELQTIKSLMEAVTDENVRLTKQVDLDKIKQEGLVAKINEIIHGKSSTAKEMMIREDVKSGFLGKRSGRFYIQMTNKTKKLESMLEEVMKNSKAKETEMGKQIDQLMKEKEQVMAENSALQEHIVYYESLNNTRNGINTPEYSQTSLESGFPMDLSHNSSTSFRRPVKPPRGKPPLLNHISSLKSQNHLKKDTSNDIVRDNNDDNQSDIKFRFKKPMPLDLRHSRSESMTMDIPFNESHLEVNVKAKGKKMSWEGRVVKHDDQCIYFYDRDLEKCHLKLFFTSLIFIRSVSSVDVIHAKKSEIPRIFQILYDKNENILLTMQKPKTITRSSISINSADSHKSSKSNSSNEVESPSQSEIVDKKPFRKNSLTRFIPLIANKVYKSKENFELCFDNINQSPVFLRGHIFIPFATEEKSNCNICSRPLNHNNNIHTSSSVLGSPENSKTLPLSSTTKTLPESYLTLNKSFLTISVDKTYQCYHCSIKAHGYDLDQKIFLCKQSIAIQLCRASSEASQCQWIKYLNNFVKSPMNSSFSPGLSTPNVSRNRRELLDK